MSLEAENNPQVGADGDAPISAQVAFQRMQPKPRQIEFLWPGGGIEPRQHTGNLVGLLWADCLPVVIFVKALQAAMSKVPDHEYL